MGLTKRWLEERYRRGYGEPDEDLAVCSVHVGDPFLKFALDDRADDETPCTFCEGPTIPGAPLEVLCEMVADALHRVYETASDAGVPRDEGDWVFPVQDTYDVVGDLCLDGEIEWEVSGTLVELFDDEAWVPRYALEDTPDLRLQAGWDRFCSYVKHQSRFLLMGSEELAAEAEFDDPFDPHAMLRDLSKALFELDLVSSLEAATPLYRARSVEEPKFTSIEQFTSPPDDLASQGRMNPAGISMFYGALDAETAAVEVYRGEPRAAVATFYLVRELDIVDLTKVPSPSLFDPSVPLRKIYVAKFLRNFIRDISKPIVHDDRVHRDYIPTQVLTEYLRYRLLPYPASLDGIAFPSSVNPGGTNVVVFVGSSGCLDDEELGDLERTDEQMLRCNRAEYVTFEFESPRPVHRNVREFGPALGATERR